MLLLLALALTRSPTPADTVPPAAVFTHDRGWIAPDPPALGLQEPDFQAGRKAGVEAARRDPRPGFAVLAAGAAGGVLLGMGALAEPLAAGVGLAVVVIAAESGSTDPSSPLVQDARRQGPDYADGFTAGFRTHQRSQRRKSAWAGAGVGLGAVLIFIVSVFSSGYT